MMTILKRTTAIAAIAALPIAAGAAGAQDQKSGDQQAQKIYQDQGSSQAGQELERTIESQVEIPGLSDDVGQSSQTERQPAQTGAEADVSQSTGQSSEKAGQPAAGESTTEGGQQAESGKTVPDEQQGQQAQAGAGDAADATVATVNQKPIKQSEVMGVIAMLPPELQNQPPAVLIPMAIDQLVLRELILQRAEKEGLADDEDVRNMAQDTSQEAVDNAMVQVWLDRSLADAASPQAVQDTYGAIVAQLGDQAPPLDAVRPQIEQELRQQAFSKIADDLQAGAEIVLFGPDGKPLSPTQ